MINPIDNYALTSGQPGVINEEAYTVLELVGQVGAKTNECVAQLNQNTQTTGELDERVTAAQAAADAAQAAADAAQEAADAAQDDVDAVESEIIVPVVSLPLIQYEEMGEPGQIPVLSAAYIGPNGYIPNILNQVFKKFTCDLTQESQTGYTKEFLIKGKDRATTGDFLNGCGKVSICPRNSAEYGTKASFIYEIHIAYMLGDNSQQAEPELIDIWGSGSIIRGNYIASDGGIPVISLFYNKLANWVYNSGRV